MTPSEYISRIDELIRGGRDEEALDLAARVGADMMSRLTSEEFCRVTGLLEGAELAVSTTPEVWPKPGADEGRPARTA